MKKGKTLLIAASIFVFAVCLTSCGKTYENLSEYLADNPDEQTNLQSTMENNIVMPGGVFSVDENSYIMTIDLVNTPDAKGLSYEQLLTEEYQGQFDAMMNGFASDSDVIDCLKTLESKAKINGIKAVVKLVYEGKDVYEGEATSAGLQEDSGSNE